MQAPFAQQPFGHEAAVHTHWPPEHTWPATQLGERPQRHAPLPEHESAFDASHAVHARPDGAQFAADSTVHTPDLRQPVGHEVASHTHALFTHRCPAAHAGPMPHAHTPEGHWLPDAPHAAHTFPPAPHADALGGLTQTAPWQQPVGQLAWSHSHLPSLHACPLPHAGSAPHRHVPSAAHWSALFASHA